VAGDREQVGPEAALAAKLSAAAQAREERLLHQLVGLAVDLVLEEAKHRLEVTGTG